MFTTPLKIPITASNIPSKIVLIPSHARFQSPVNTPAIKSIMPPKAFIIPVAASIMPSKALPITSIIKSKSLFNAGAKTSTMSWTKGNTNPFNMSNAACINFPTKFKTSSTNAFKVFVPQCT